MRFCCRPDRHSAKRQGGSAVLYTRLSYPSVYSSVYTILFVVACRLLYSIYWPGACIVHYYTSTVHIYLPSTARCSLRALPLLKCLFADSTVFSRLNSSGRLFSL